MRSLILSIPLVLIALCGVIWFLRRPPRYRKRVDDDLTKFFKALRDEDYENGFLVIEAPNKKRFIQFARYTRKKKAGIQFDFPLAPWSEKYYEKLKTVLEDHGIDCETQTTGQATVVSFITVDLKQDLAKAMELSRLVLLEVFKLKPRDRIKIFLSQ